MAKVQMPPKYTYRDAVRNTEYIGLPDVSSVIGMALILLGSLVLILGNDYGRITTLATVMIMALGVLLVFFSYKK